MTANNLTRDEARERARLLNVASTVVDLDLTEQHSDTRTFRSTSVIGFTCTEPGASTFLEVAADRIDEVTLNGTALDPASCFDGERIRLTGLADRNELRVVAECRYSRTGEGLHRFVDPVDDAVYLYTQFETYDAHRMYACFDQPDLKTMFALTVTAPSGWTCVSNAAPELVEEVGDGAKRWVFAPTPRIATYITALVAGPYHSVHTVHDGIPLGLYCRRSLAEFLDADELFEVTGQGFDFFHAAFDYRYPFGKYDQLFVPEFNAGAMENAGCVTFLEDYVFRSKVTDARRERRAETVLHEMAHMWFGDLVTMRWWGDLWLNESFATYMSVLAQATSTRWTNAWTTFCNAEKTWAYRQDQLPSTHPVVADAPDIETVKTNFDGITYAKGASVLKQLVAWVGREEFLAGMRAYFRRHEYGNADLADLLTALEEASGRDLRTWSKEWLETAGVNTLRPRFEVDSDGTYRSFEVLQEATPEHPTLRSHRLAIGLYDLVGSGDTRQLIRRDRVELDVIGAVTDVAKLVGARRADVVLLNDDDLTYAKIRLDPDSFAVVREHIADFAESLPRALCWAAAWDMTRDGELPASEYVRLVESGVGAESDIGVVQSLLAKASTAATQYAAPAHRDPLLNRLAALTAQLLETAPPGSDYQLAYAYAFASLARPESERPDDVARLRGLLDGSLPIAGLTVDTELRWALLTRLVVLGAAGDSEIDAEHAADRTATGEKRATTARAARPTPEAKEAAWQAVMNRDDLSNHLQIATMAGFMPFVQAELVRPYIDRYFAEIGAVFESRTLDSAITIAEMLFPSVFVEEQIVERVDAFLERANPTPALRRLLVERRDDVRRALAAQACDAEAAAVADAGQ